MSRLCTACGLCCNGVLFADVELQKTDDPQRLRALGLTLRTQRRKACVLQPCSGFDGKLCRLYADRPAHCRAFECRLLQRAQAGEITVSAALQSIRRARDEAERVRDLLKELGQADESLPLTRRYSETMAEPIDLEANRRAATLRGRLATAMARLMRTVQRDFLG